MQLGIERFFDVIVLIIVVAIIIAIVTHAESAQVINATGDAFANSVRAALGK